VIYGDDTAFARGRREVAIIEADRLEIVDVVWS